MAANDDTLTKLSTDATTDFVQSFYPTLQSNRPAISSYYSDTISTILFNGNIVAGGKAVQDIFMSQMPSLRYEVQSYDCQIINPAYPMPTVGSKFGGRSSAKNMSILIIVSGHVRFGDGSDVPQRGFSETFVLVPNPVTAGKEWLIQSQNFRLVV